MNKHFTSGQQLADYLVQSWGFVSDKNQYKLIKGKLSLSYSVCNNSLYWEINGKILHGRISAFDEFKLYNTSDKVDEFLTKTRIDKSE